MAGSVLLNISEIQGNSLLPMDRNGSSDPYVKILQCDKVLHKTKAIKNTLNPRWNEIHIRVDSLDNQIILKVNKTSNAINAISNKTLKFLEDSLLPLLLSGL